MAWLPFNRDVEHRTVSIEGATASVRVRGVLVHDIDDLMTRYSVYGYSQADDLPAVPPGLA